MKSQIKRNKISIENDTTQKKLVYQKLRIESIKKQI